MVGPGTPRGDQTAPRCARAEAHNKGTCTGQAGPARGTIGRQYASCMSMICTSHVEPPRRRCTYPRARRSSGPGARARSGCDRSPLSRAVAASPRLDHVGHGGRRPARVAIQLQACAGLARRGGEHLVTATTLADLARQAYVYGFPLVSTLDQMARYVTMGMGSNPAASFNSSATPACCLPRRTPSSPSTTTRCTRWHGSTSASGRWC